MNERFKKLREHLKKTQIDFAGDLNTNQQGISNIEKKVKQIPFEIIEILNNKFRVNLNWLIMGEGEMFINDGLDRAEEPISDYEIKNNFGREIDSIKKRLEVIENKLNSL